MYLRFMIIMMMHDVTRSEMIKRYTFFLYLKASLSFLRSLYSSYTFWSFALSVFLLILELSKQLIWLIGLAFVLLFISLGLVLPKMIIPVAENNLYTYLSEPLKLVNTGNMDYKILDTEIAYIYAVGDEVVATDNFKDIIYLMIGILIKLKMLF